jgi:hypothetical protein
MDAGLKSSILGLIQAVSVIMGVGFGGWALVCLTRQQIQKSIFFFTAGIFLLSLWDFVQVSRNTFSFTGISLSQAVESQNSGIASTLNTLDFAFSSIGIVFFIKSILMFSRIPTGQNRPSECFVVLIAAIVLNNFGSILQILLNSISAK